MKTPQPSQQETTETKRSEPPELLKPMKVGNSWLYRVTEPNGTVRRVLRTISETKRIEGEVVYHYEVIDPDDQYDFGGYDQLYREGAVCITGNRDQRNRSPCYLPGRRDANRAGPSM